MNASNKGGRLWEVTPVPAHARLIKNSWTSLIRPRYDDVTIKCPVKNIIKKNKNRKHIKRFVFAPQLVRRVDYPIRLHKLLIKNLNINEFRCHVIANRVVKWLLFNVYDLFYFFLFYGRIISFESVSEQVDFDRGCSRMN